jgi:hypothetical protein
MTRAEFIELLCSLPEIRELKNVQEGDKPAFCGRLLDISVNDVVLAHNWDFAMDSTFQALTVGTGTVRLEGKNQDCMGIYSLAWGSGTDESTYVPIDRRNPGEVTDWLSRHTPAECEIWIPQRPDELLPVVKLFATPATAGQSLFYQYWVKGLKYEDLPEQFESVLKARCRYQVFPASWRDYDFELRQLIARYMPPGVDDDPAPLPPETIVDNRRRAGLYGY